MKQWVPWVGAGIVAIISFATFAWVIINSIIKRDFARKMTSKVEGEIEFINNAPYMQVSYSLQNNGNRKIDIDPIGTALLVYAVPSHRSQFEGEWKNIKAYDAFKGHSLEPGELVQDNRQIAIPDNKTLSFIVEICIMCKGREYSDKKIVNW